MTVVSVVIKWGSNILVDDCTCVYSFESNYSSVSCGLECVCVCVCMYVCVCVCACVRACFLSESRFIMSVSLSGMKRRDGGGAGGREYHRTPRWKPYQTVKLGESAALTHTHSCCVV